VLEDKIIYPFEMNEKDYVLIFQEARNRGVSTKQILNEAIRTYIQDKIQNQGGEE